MKPLVCLMTALVLLMGSVRARAAADKGPHPDAPPEVLRNANRTVEIGTIEGTPYRIDVPANWNHALIVFFHGYSETPVIFRTAAPLSEQLQPLVDRGYAVAQSAYSTTGWALAEAFPETEKLRLYFVEHYAKPAQGKAAKTMETYVAGFSMGGALVAATLEQNPKPYAGGLDMCGSVGPADLNFQRRFAWRAAFDFYYPNLLPPLVPAPLEFRENRDLRQRVEAALYSSPSAAAALKNLTGMRNEHELASEMVYFTFVLADMARRAGGNPYDNRNYLYSGTSTQSSTPDNLLNDGVHRYAADPRARGYLIRHYTPTGRLGRPMLALHTTYDDKVPLQQLAIYGEQVALAGASDNLVQQYVHRDGHCTFTQEEIGHTFDELVLWVHANKRPVPGLLPTPSVVR